MEHIQELVWIRPNEFKEYMMAHKHEIGPFVAKTRPLHIKCAPNQNYYFATFFHMCIWRSEQSWKDALDVFYDVVEPTDVVYLLIWDKRNHCKCIELAYHPRFDIAKLLEKLFYGNSPSGISMLLEKIIAIVPTPTRDFSPRDSTFLDYSRNPHKKRKEMRLKYFAQEDASQIFCFTLLITNKFFTI